MHIDHLSIYITMDITIDIMLTFNSYIKTFLSQKFVGMD